MKINGICIEKNTKVKITELNPVTSTIKLKINDTYNFELKKGSRFMRIIIPETDKNSDPFKEIRMFFETKCKSEKILKKEISQYEKDLFIEISGFTGNKIGNISINNINGKHNLKIIIPDDIWKNNSISKNLKSNNTFTDNIYDYNIFYIEMLKKFDGDYNPIENIITVTFFYIGGIPISYFKEKELHDITEKNNNSYTISLYREPRIRKGDRKLNFGKSAIIDIVSDVVDYYPNPNSYKYNLETMLSNVVQINVKSTNFPNTFKNITDKNNKLYWKNLNDGNEIYSITIKNGNYTLDKLINIMENKINQTDRIEISEKKFLNKNIMKFTDNSISCYKKAILQSPFINLKDNIITIECVDHDLEVNETICVENSLSYAGVPAEIINGTHKVIEVIDYKTFKIYIGNYNSDNSNGDKGGGNNVNILMPDFFTILNDQENCINELFRFENKGYDKIINYNFRDTYDDKYIIMVCENLNIVNNIENKGEIKNFFCKISVNDEKILLNTFTNTPMYFHDTIEKLYELNFKFYDKHGELYDFDNMDHSFVLEVITINKIPKGTGINSFGTIV
jgi:hypothetical protein